MTNQDNPKPVLPGRIAYGRRASRLAQEDEG